uniref:Uncharacterized protein n=1 Tax=Nymphaea colorata TaxID=210225 RepID=A0A5K1FJ02_9MAGN|nr:unnamed protein product [Nymphaea colorata]VVW60716.1 unnamed protein product [Nymphaea colorata]VVW60726.1 unnamed protein product [Nymphaea colorata]VVW60728.1 unnamed protein product [Nymphaea colorata]VVW60730.1 unnamed protein product [Nymphaea colorata]
MKRMQQAMFVDPLAAVVDAAPLVTPAAQTTGAADQVTYAAAIMVAVVLMSMVHS